MKSGQIVLLSLFVAGTASAQVAASATSQSGSGSAASSTAVDAQSAGAADAWNAKPVGKFQITLAMPSHEMTADVTLREENGKLIANIWPVGDNDGRDFGASVMGNQLVISGPTERGALNLTLEHRGPKISGTWQFGEQKGALAGHFVN